MSKTVLITGASRGIGKAIALKFATEDYNIIITCNTNTSLLIEVQNTIISLGRRCLAYTGTLTSSANVKELSKLVADTFGHVDILINNAGISYMGLLTDMSDSDWDNVMNSNVNSAFYCCREFIPGMVSNKCGRIINISSVWGNIGASCEVAYSASKGAINSFTKALAKELAPSGIAVNAVACGLIDTDMNKCFNSDELNEIYDDIPAGRAGTVEETAELVYSIAKQSYYMTGQIITLDGGWT